MIDGLFGTVRFVVKNSNFFFTICVIGHLTWFKKGGLMGYCDLVIQRPLLWLKRSHVCVWRWLVRYWHGARLKQRLWPVSGTGARVGSITAKHKWR